MDGLQPAVAAALLAAEPEPELEALAALVTDTRDPFGDGMSTPKKKDGVPPPIGDPGAMVRTGSNRSGRTSASSPTEFLERVRTDSDLDSELEALRKTQHIVESEVFAEDLTATWHDQQAGITDWRKCLVSGSHLKTKEEKKDGSKAMADAGAAGEVLRAVWKSSIQVAIKKNLNSLIENEDEVKLFLELHHPHVVACYGILKENSMNSIVTERCTTSLEAFRDDHNVWKDKSPDVVDMIKYTIVQHVALGLQKLHDMNVLHRDIKANNILLDGAAGACPTCDHSGKWKICDFGEAKVLKTPSLAFGEPQDWPRGWSYGLIAAKRFQKVTSPFLRAQGARWYCWLMPGEKLTPEADHALPEGMTEGATEWAPCNQGGFVYSFSDGDGSENESGPAGVSPYDCFFDIEGTHDKPIQPSGKIFPATLGPFGLVLTELLPELNLKESSYELRKRIHRNEELEKLKSFLPEGKMIQGVLSPVAELTLPTSAKRTAMIPDESTHFVWAYQGVDLEKLTQEQTVQLETTSGEISFVSLGGYVYLKQLDDDEDGNPAYIVLQANAISLGEGKTCRTGTVHRSICGQDACNPDVFHVCDDGTPCDNGLTAAVASPELIDGVGIGLETDIYAFGIVMWEVFTRREAWHWITGGLEKDQTIITQVGVFGRRPKMPDNLSPDCAKRVRKCLHTNPGQRPSAKEIGVWINKCRTALGDSMESSARVKVRERDFHGSAHKGGKTTRWPNKAIHDRNDEQWSRRGRYSLHTSQLTCGTTPGFSMTVIECTQDMWMENALEGKETEVEPLGKLALLKPNPFGLKFEKNDGHGGKLKLWPQVTEASSGNTIADEFPSITVGSAITKINGKPVPATFKAALPVLKRRPLTLEFTSAVAESTDVVQSWIQAGLLEIGLVRRHENMKLIKHREDVAMCGRPHCGDGYIHPEEVNDAGDHIWCSHTDSGAFARTEPHGPVCLEHKGLCPLRRTSSGWLSLARMDSKPQAEPEPEPEPEPLAKVSVDTMVMLPVWTSSGELRQSKTTQSFAKMAVMWAAMDAGRDAVAVLRAHENEIPEGVPP